MEMKEMVELKKAVKKVGKVETNESYSSSSKIPVYGLLLGNEQVSLPLHTYSYYS
jgi:hypothetical protein